MGTFGWTEILIILGVLILFFGAKKIPELARGIGEGMTEFKKATQDEINENNDQTDSKGVNESKKQ